VLRDWKERRAAKAQERLVEETFSDAFGHPSYRHIRNWDLEELHRRLATNELHSAERRMAESQVRIREAWRTPARWSLILSIAAFAVSAIALIVSIWS
jgi:hypothetical protein